MTNLAWLSGLGHGLLVALGLLVYVMATRIGHQRRHPSAALAWVLGIVAFPYAAIPLFLLLGSRKLARPVHRHQVHGVPEAGAGPLWAAQWASSMELPPALPNERIVLHANGSEAWQSLLDTIASAEHQLDVCTYILAGDAIGQQVADALRASARRGVVVRLLIDALGSMRVPPQMLRQLRRHGVQVRHYRPLLHNPLRGRANLRNHRKLVVADGRRLWAGGRNFACEYFEGQPGQAAWVDLSYDLVGPVAAQAHVQFNTDWRTATGPMLRKMRKTPAPSAPGSAGLQGPWAQWLASGPDHADDTLHALLLAAAYHAQSSIVAVTPYFVPDDALLDAWCMACRRGVQIHLLVPARSNHRLADIARERALRALVAVGAHIHLADHMVHAKAVLIDRSMGLVGSLNLDARSLFLNYEAMVAFYSETQIQWLAQWCAQQRALAQPYHARVPSWRRDILEGLVRAVGFQL